MVKSRAAKQVDHLPSTGSGSTGVAAIESASVGRAIISTPSAITSCTSCITVVHSSLAALDGVTHLATVLTLDLGPILRLRAIAGEMTLLLAVAAGNIVGVKGLVALLRDMILGTTVAASTSRTSLNVGTVASEMTQLFTLVAGDIGSRARFSAVSSLVALLVAVIASIVVDTRLRAVTHAVTLLLAVVADDLRSGTLTFDLLLRARLGDMTKFTTVAAERNTTVLGKASRLEALEILFSILGPAYGELGATRLILVLDRQDELAIGEADQVNNGEGLGHIVRSQGLEIHRDIVFTQGSLNSGKIKLFTNSTGVSLEASFEGIDLLGASGIDKLSPGLLGVELGNTGPVHDTTLLAIYSLVTMFAAEPTGTLRVARAISSAMTLLAAGVAGAGKRPVDAWICAIRLVVTATIHVSPRSQ